MSLISDVNTLTEKVNKLNTSLATAMGSTDTTVGATYVLEQLVNITNLLQLEIDRATKRENAIAAYSGATIGSNFVFNFDGYTNLSTVFSTNKYLTNVKIDDIGNATNLSSFCSSIIKLQTFELNKADYVTNISSMLSSSTNLTTVKLGNFPLAITMASICSSDAALQSFTIGSLPLLSIASSAFSGCITLQSLVLPDMPEATLLDSLCNGCALLTSFKVGTLPKVTTLKSAFNGCTNIQSIELPDMPSLTDITSMCYSCNSLINIKIGDMPKLVTTTTIFTNSTNIKNIEIGSMDSLVDLTNLMISTPTVFKIKNLGVCKNTTSIKFNNTWNNSTQDSLDSMIYTLVTSSYDRAKAGYSICTIQIKNASLALLTQEQIAAITAKGFTITGY